MGCLGVTWIVRARLADPILNRVGRAVVTGASGKILPGLTVLK